MNKTSAKSEVFFIFVRWKYETQCITSWAESMIISFTLNDKNNLFASKYLLYLPKEEELKQIIDQTESVLNWIKKIKTLN